MRGRTFLPLMLLLALMLALASSDKAVADPDEFGYHPGGSPDPGNWAGVEDVIVGSWFVAPSGGTITSITAYIRDIQAEYKYGVYRYSDNALTGYTVVGEGPQGDGWRTFNITSGGSITAGENYFLVAWADEIMAEIAFDENVSGKGMYDAQSYGAWPEPLVPVFDNKKCWIYATYTPSLGWQEVGTWTNYAGSGDASVWQEVGTWTNRVSSAWFGYMVQGSLEQSVENRITGSWFIPAFDENVASISAWISDPDGPAKYSYAIYRVQDDALLGYTDNFIYAGGGPWFLQTENLITAVPVTTNVEYWLVVWGETDTSVAYDIKVGTGGYQPLVFGGWPATEDFSLENKKVSIYCSYAFPTLEWQEVVTWTNYMDAIPLLRGWDTPRSIENKSGEEGGQPAINTIDKNIGTYWKHSFQESTWIIFDLEESLVVQKFRIWQPDAIEKFGGSVGMTAWVSDNVDDWGDNVWEGALNAPGWQESGYFEKEGRYIYLYNNDSGEAGDQRFYEFEALVARKYTPLADAHVNWSFPDTNYGSETLLEIDNRAYCVSIIIRFGEVVEIENIVRARLFMRCEYELGWGYHRLYKQTSTAWSENAVTWNNKPSTESSELDHTLVTSYSYIYDHWWSFDVTDAVTSEDTGFELSDNGGINSDCLTQFWSKEGSYPPYLLVEWDNAPPLANTAPVANDNDNVTVSGDTATIIYLPVSDADGDNMFAVAFDKTDNYRGDSADLTGNPPYMRIYTYYGWVEIKGGVGGNHQNPSQAPYAIYTPDNEYRGQDEFTYEVFDIYGAHDNATIIIFVVDPTEMWHEVGIWTNHMEMRDWHEVGTWTNYTAIHTWHEVGTWTNYMYTLGWYTVGTWTNYTDATTTDWSEVGTWTNYMIVSTWYEVGTWTNLLNMEPLPGWHEVGTWTNYGQTPVLQEVGTWTNEIRAVIYVAPGVEPLVTIDVLINLIIVPLIVLFAPALLLAEEHGFAGFVIGMCIGLMVIAVGAIVSLTIGMTLLILISIVILWWRGHGGGE